MTEREALTILQENVKVLDKVNDSSDYQDYCDSTNYVYEQISEETYDDIVKALNL